MSRVLILVAHRDDETLGAGGAISWHRAKGDEVQVISMTDGVSARKVGGSLEERGGRIISSVRVAEFLDFSWRDSGNFPDNAMDTVPILEIIRFIEKAKSEFKPEVVYTHFPFDLNIDHVLTAKAVFTAFRPEPGEACRELLSFEVPSSTDFGSFLGAQTFRPNYFVDLDRTLQKKTRCSGYVWLGNSRGSPRAFPRCNPHFGAVTRKSDWNSRGGSVSSS